MDKFLVICGPTATGKTKLGVAMAKKYNGEILSADSRQVYKGMDVATGKDLKEYGKIKVWGLDLVSPDYPFNVSDYVNYANDVLKDIASRGKLPVIVGGTGQYIKELLRPSQTLHIPPNEKLRKKLDRYNLSELQKELQKVDTKKWQNMNESDRMNPRRLVRAIEVATANNGIMDKRQGTIDWKTENKKRNVLIVGLTAPYEFLYQRIDKRVEDRVKNGMEEEIKKLLAAGYTKDLPSMSGLGYREFPDLAKWKRDEHDYARRQMTYFRHQFPKIKWFDVSDSEYLGKIEVSVAIFCSSGGS